MASPPEPMERALRQPVTAVIDGRDTGRLQSSRALNHGKYWFAQDDFSGCAASTAG